MNARIVRSEFGEIGLMPWLPNDLVRGLFSFRQGGVSQVPFESLNVGLHVGDNASDVTTNRERCARVLGGELSDWIVAEQVHGTNVAVVGANDRGHGALTHESAIKGADGLITNESGLTLVVLAADCVPVLFYDPVQRVIAVAHSGWKGTIGHIALGVIDKMTEEFQSRPEDIFVWLGPSIRRCCYEVDERVAAPVRTEFGEKYLLPRFGHSGKYYFSMQRCIEADLLERGVIPSHIYDTGICTSCRNQTVFSHRADAGKTGRILGAIRLRDSFLYPAEGI